jgi:hypothetical protein
MNLPFVSQLFEYSKMPNTTNPSTAPTTFGLKSQFETLNPIPKGIGVVPPSV